ncbi:MAG TPA: VCBS repeat-containing protein [Polyangiaceae bacterium]|nr:VCBS repeat-containing protein [Polyangiaceae bacterium]
MIQIAAPPRDGKASRGSVPVAFSYGNGAFWISNENHWDFSAWAQWPNAKPIVGDFNGDGRDDIALLGSESFGSIPVALSNGNGTFNVSAPPLDSFPGWASAPGVVALSGRKSQ